MSSKYAVGISTCSKALTMIPPSERTSTRFTEDDYLSKKVLMSMSSVRLEGTTGEEAVISPEELDSKIGNGSKTG